MAAIVASADGGAASGERQHFGPTEDEVRQTQLSSLLRERGPMMELNCGGVVHCVYEETLRRVPHTLLANLVDDADVRAKLPRDPKGRIFFDRHPQAFFEILVRAVSSIRPAPAQPSLCACPDSRHTPFAELLPHRDTSRTANHGAHDLGV